MSSAMIFLLLAIAALAGIAWKYFKTRSRFGGAMLVSCPENQEAVSVKVDSHHAGVKSLAGKQELRLTDCTRWPERQNCGQACLAQIEAQPANCQVQCILTNWYLGKFCVYCRKPFAEIHWHDHKPALLSPDRNLREWQDIQVETLPEVLESHYPVCWNCLVAESFRRDFPDLVIERPWKHT
jgi:hypothetical protein